MRGGAGSQRQLRAETAAPSLVNELIPSHHAQPGAGARLPYHVTQLTLRTCDEFTRTLPSRPALVSIFGRAFVDALIDEPVNQVAGGLARSAQALMVLLLAEGQDAIEPPATRTTELPPFTRFPSSMRVDRR